MISIRKFAPSDTEEVLRLFYNTVHTVNSLDYSPEQLDAWAPAQPDHKKWRTRLKESRTLVAESDNRIVGFGNLEKEKSAIGMLYVHKDHLHKGIATALLIRLEKKIIKKRIPVAAAEVSQTARPFFEKRGYQLIRENRKNVNGMEFLNFIMEKKLPLKAKEMKNKPRNKKPNYRRDLTLSKFVDLLIVIVGVSIAFQLNAWRSEAEQKSQERFYFESMLVDLDKDMNECDLIMKDIQGDLSMVKRYLKLLEQPAPPADSLGIIIVNTLGFETFDGSQNTYSMMQGSNGMSTISDRTIRGDITEYYRHYVSVTRFEEVYTNLLFQMNNYFLPYCDYTTLKIMDTTVVEKMQTRNYFMLTQSMLEDATETYTAMQDKARALKNNLEARLRKSK